MIAAGAGDDNSLERIWGAFMAGLATKDDYEKALRAHKGAKDEMRSDQREAYSALPNSVNFWCHVLKKLYGTEILKYVF